MESMIVIKVQCENILRRFSARVVDEQLDLDIFGLRKRALGFFSFSPDADITLTYIDEDGDVVTLVDNEDLHDAVKQSLNPLRITVKLNSEKSAQLHAKSSGSSTPKRSQAQLGLCNLNVNDYELLTTIQEPFIEAITKLPIKSGPKVSSSAPVIAETLDGISKLGLSYLKPFSEFQASAESNKECATSGYKLDAPIGEDLVYSEFQASAESNKECATSGYKLDAPIGKDLVYSDASKATSEVQQNIAAKSPALLGNFVSPNAECDENNLTNNKTNYKSVTKRVPASSIPSLAVDASVSLGTGCAKVNRANPMFGAPHFVNGQEELIHVSSGSDKLKMDLNEYPPTWMSNGLTILDVMSASCASAGNTSKETMKESECCLGGKSVSISTSTISTGYLNPNTSYSKKASLDGGVIMKSSCNYGNSCPPYDLNPVKMALANASDAPALYGAPVVPFKTAYYHNNTMVPVGNIFHQGVQCDGYGIHPITGPLLKSKVKDDYNLCQIWSEQRGNMVDNIRMDWAMTNRYPYAVRRLYGHQSSVCPPTPPKVSKGCGIKSSLPKLDSCFIQDVNVFDGNIKAPSMPFVKIWRMRNNGTVTWPQGTNLVWIGGDRLSSAQSVELEIAADGVAVGEELDIAVSFSAPELPGRYISFWKMSSPSGQKFGKRVWVLIQVDAYTRNTVCERVNGLNLNMTFHNNTVAGHEIMNINDEPTVEFLKNDRLATNPIEPIAPPADPIKEQKLDLPIPELLLVTGMSSTPPTETFPSASQTIINLSKVSSALPSSSLPTITEQNTNLVDGNNDLMLSLFREPKEMCSEQVALNREILSSIEDDMEHTRVDGCGIACWDLLLQELQNMGFHDIEKNKRLLKKHNGSIKRAVMDLIANEKD